jgi:hypothetical protein
MEPETGCAATANDNPRQPSRTTYCKSRCRRFESCRGTSTHRCAYLWVVLGRATRALSRPALSPFHDGCLNVTPKSRYSMAPTNSAWTHRAQAAMSEGLPRKGMHCAAAVLGTWCVVPGHGSLFCCPRERGTALGVVSTPPITRGHNHCSPSTEVLGSARARSQGV